MREQDTLAEARDHYISLYNDCIKNCDDGGCFAAGTKILMSDNTIKNIEDIKVGDYIVAYDENTQQFVNKRVFKSFPHRNTAKMIRVELSNGTTIDLTPGHPLLTTQGWKSKDLNDSLYEHKVEATWLHVGDTVLGYDTDVQVVDINDINISSNYTSYNIAVEDCHTFVANNIVVHNSDSKGGEATG